MQDFIVQNFKDVSFFKRVFGDPFIFIIVVTIGWYKFCIGIFCLAIEDVIFNCLVQRVDAGKKFKGLKRRRTIFIASLIPPAFEEIGNDFLARS